MAVNSAHDGSVDGRVGDSLELVLKKVMKEILNKKSMRRGFLSFRFPIAISNFQSITG
jgi:hypothetical protein